MPCTDIASAKKLTSRIKNAVRNKYIAEQREQYNEYRAESRACGYEVETFEEYIGERNLKSEAAEFYSSLTNQQLLDC